MLAQQNWCLISDLLKTLGNYAESLRSIDILLNCRNTGTLEEGIIKLLFVTVDTLRANWRALLVKLVAWLIAESVERVDGFIRKLILMSNKPTDR